jgi:hypothetical protein
MNMFGEKGGAFNRNTKEHHLNSYKNALRAGHTVVLSAVQKRYFLPDFPVIAESLLER